MTHRAETFLVAVILAIGCRESSAATNNPAPCDKSLWNHVYNPSRLHVVSECVVATGVITAIGPDDDGDAHMLVRLDRGQEKLVNKTNRKKRHGNLVAEVVCASSPTLHKAKKSCKGYQSSVSLPKVGQHVEIAGTSVVDSHNGWMEIHPVTSIVVK